MLAHAGVRATGGGSLVGGGVELRRVASATSVTAADAASAAPPDCTGYASASTGCSTRSPTTSSPSATSPGRPPTADVSGRPYLRRRGIKRGANCGSLVGPGDPQPCSPRSSAWARSCRTRSFLPAKPVGPACREGSLTPPIGQSSRCGHGPVLVGSEPPLNPGRFTFVLFFDDVSSPVVDEQS